MAQLQNHQRGHCPSSPKRYSKHECQVSRGELHAQACSTWLAVEYHANDGASTLHFVQEEGRHGGQSFVLSFTIEVYGWLLCTVH